MSRLVIGNTTRPKPLINIGALFDIPTGMYQKGAKGENILNGGLSTVTGIVGLGNNFKSTIAHYMMLKAADRIECSVPDATMMHTYDTENNMNFNLERYDLLANNMTTCLPRNPVTEEVWTIVTKADMPAEIWLKEVLYKLKTIKEKEVKKIKLDCFYDKKTKKPLEELPPSFIEIDSLTEFEPSTTEDMLESNSIDKTNMMYMQQGAFRARVLKDLPRIANTANIYFILTAHLGDKKDLAQGPFSKPTKDLQYMKQNEKIKGTTDKFLFLTTHLWKAHSSTALKNQNTGLPEYPMYENDIEVDLNLVKLTQFRSKTGPSGYTIELIVSQNEGVLPELTEFHYIKTNKFGLGGNPRSYWIELYPDIKLQRTTVRRKLKEDYKLARAVNITAELLQLKKFKPAYGPLLCDPNELYEDIKKLGYDWNILLNTRGWWTPKNYDPKLRPYLSTMDLLKMRKGEYVPFWIDEKTKQPKKEYSKWFDKEEKEKKNEK